MGSLVIQLPSLLVGGPLQFLLWPTIANEKKELTLGMRASEQHKRATGNWKNAPTAIVLIS
jgi:hypothetical protein